jgi:hypothetical protein
MMQMDIEIRRYFDLPKSFFGVAAFVSYQPLILEQFVEFPEIWRERHKIGSRKERFTARLV